MPHSEGLKFKHTIIDNWTLPPEPPSHLEPVRPAAPVQLPSVGRHVPIRPEPPRPFTPVSVMRSTVMGMPAPVPEPPAPTPPEATKTPPQPFVVPAETTPKPPNANAQPAVEPAPPAPEPARTAPASPATAPEPEAENGAKRSTLMRWTDTEAIVTTGHGNGHTEVHELVEIPVDVDRRLVMLYGQATEQARAYRLLRHRLLSLGDPRVIAVSSAEPGEGKTTCAANLGLALADETLARVLLVDANLGRPSLAEAFGFEPSDSFMERLVTNRDVTPPYLVAAVRGTRLHVAALPQQRPRPGHIDRLLLTAALHDLRSEYDYIVIDAAAVFESADADVAGECADGVLLTARAGSSRRSRIEAAIQQLSPSTVLGTVLLDS
ncbi:MAG TPA: CpsD/CapB family tyrosine-protein kinase [Polyangiaceae bacterium]|nr:CpsD/CapB family tyrosine-protein kinase [Polyangiaceae bacterium]